MTTSVAGSDGGRDDREEHGVFGKRNYLQLAVKASGAAERGVQRVGSITGGKNNNAPRPTNRGTIAVRVAMSTVKNIILAVVFESKPRWFS
jgi:hypothetical protein